MPKIRRALISVSDKRGVIEFASALREMHVEILSTGGTASSLRGAGIEVRNVSDVTGYPEILGGRVKTLHPLIHGALLALPGDPEHVRQTKELGIEPIDMVVVNLYPFERSIARPGVTLDEALEQIDIGGPSMLRSASKNFRNKAVIVNPDRYPAVLAEMKSCDGCVGETMCAALAREVFHHTSRYDAAIAAYLEAATETSAGLPAMLSIAADREYNLRYGENPHQRGALYGGFSSLFRTLHGKELSYNNIVDIAAAAQVVAEFDAPTVAIIKHTNPCGVGSAPAVADAYERALATDRSSAFGGIVALNRPLDMATAVKINEVFTEVILAPGIPADVLEFLRKKRDRRIIQLTADLRGRREPDVRSVPGGFLLQDPDTGDITREEFRVVTRRSPTAAETEALRFAWRVAKHVKSNAIVYAAADRTLGVGAGQMSRVESARIAAQKAAEAGLDLRGSAAASDAYFPFADGLMEAVHAGSTAVIQPGGSVRDGEVVAAADDNGIAMVFTGTRHFRH
ncbi:MAG TPA: bifunctional phosphoribosylaminoimidazolecarboxamide formyltransferase/IMP cyclohydrolase [Bacteroidota bacterium]|nr:bifunctional phosphoribosylaminoimidazolecarboxamide formyltransferase/IMP cyclohydrolase [Bacteroidota bacterium]